MEVRAQGGVVTSVIVAAARGLVLAGVHSKLIEYGGLSTRVDTGHIIYLTEFSLSGERRPQQRVEI